MLLLALFTLLLGFGNYVLFQSPIWLFNVLNIAPLSTPAIENPILRQFLKGYFSDITWCVSLCLVTLVFSETKSLQKFEKLIILSLPFLTEFAQYLGLMNGNFDWIDVFIYTVIVLVFCKLFPSVYK